MQVLLTARDTLIDVWLQRLVKARKPAGPKLRKVARKRSETFVQQSLAINVTIGGQADQRLAPGILVTGVFVDGGEAVLAAALDPKQLPDVLGEHVRALEQ